jgi:hypothetical protein
MRRPRSGYYNPITARPFRKKLQQPAPRTSFITLFNDQHDAERQRWRAKQNDSWAANRRNVATPLNV